MKSAVVLVLLFAGILLGMQSLYIVEEGKQAMIVQLGNPVGKPVTNPGVHFKLPFIQEVRYVEKRLLIWDGDPERITTKDKKYIFVDTTARWKIVDALQFIKAVTNERQAQDRLDSVLDGATRNEISKHNLVEVVRNTNQILKREDFKQDVEKVQVGREEIAKRIKDMANKQTKEEFGIEIVNVELRRVSYHETVEKKVYERMRSERFREAEKYRSIGKGEKAKIEGRLAKMLKEIESEAYKKSQIIEGKAEAKAIAIYAGALKRDPKFYEFMRTMEAYKKSLKEDTKFILSSDSEFLKFLRKK